MVIGWSNSCFPGALLVVVASLAFVASALDPVSGNAAFHHSMGSSARGHVIGECEGRAIALPRAATVSVSLSGRDATLQVFETWVNYTLVLAGLGPPIRIEEGSHQQVETFPLEAGNLSVEWGGPGGRAAVLEYGGYGATSAPFRLRFDADRLRFGAATNSHRMGESWVPGEDGPRSVVFGPVGWARTAELANGTLVADGDMTFHLEHALVSAGNARHEIPPHEETRTTSAPGVERRAEHFHHALLSIRGARATFRVEDVAPICAAARLHVNGSYMASAASGDFQLAGTRWEFADRDLTLLGRFHVAESVVEIDPAADGNAQVNATAAGTFESAELDFEAVPQGRLETPKQTQTALYVLAGLGALGWGAWKAAALLYSRVRERDALEEKKRQSIHSTILERPGATVRSLSSAVVISPSSVRYHLRVLERSGHIKGVKIKGRWRYLPAVGNLDATSRRLVLESDPRIQELLGLLGDLPLPARLVVAQLQDKCSLSRAGAWRVLDRAQRASFVKKRRDRGRVVVWRSA